MVKMVSPETEKALKEAGLWLDSYTAEDVLDNLPHAIPYGDPRIGDSLYLTIFKKVDRTYGIGYYGKEGRMIIAVTKMIDSLAEEAGKLWIHLKKIGKI